MTRTPEELWRTQLPAATADASIKRLWQYIDLLIDANTRLNLTRIDSREDAAIKHIADALTLLPFLPEGPFDLCDVGTGGGVPGVPLAIARPDIQVTLVDSTRKKTDAVGDMVHELLLPNVRVLNMRSDAVTRRYQVVTARAVAAMDQLLQWTVPLLKPGGVVLALKGPRVHEEIPAAQKTIDRYKLIIETHDVTVPELSGHVIARAYRKYSPPG